MELSLLPASGSPVAAFIASDWEDPDNWSARRLRRLKGRQAVLIESAGERRPTSGLAGRPAARDGRAGGAAGAVVQPARRTRGAVHVDEEAAAYVRLPPESSTRRQLDGLLHRFTRAFHGHKL